MAKKVLKNSNETKVVAHANGVHISPRKMRLVTNLVKKTNAQTALVQLQFVNKKAAPILTKLINSAIANAVHNFSLDPNNLTITEVTCDMGQTGFRFMPRARGSASPIRRKTCHVHVTLSGSVKLANAPVASKTSKHEHAEESVQNETDKKTIKKSNVKTSEQRKMNTVTQKRRLFNRRIGE